MNQQSSYPGYERAQTTHSQHWHGDRGSSGSTGPSDALAPVNTSNNAQARVASPAGVPQYGLPSYSSQGYSSTAQSAVSSPQLVNNTATASALCGSGHAQNQAQSYPSTSTYGSLSNSYSQRQARPSSVNSARSSTTAAQPSPVTATFNRSTVAAPHYQRSSVNSAANNQRSVSPAQIQASYSLQSLGHAVQTAALNSANEYTEVSDRNAVQNASNGVSANTQYDTSSSAPVGEATATNYNQSITVDPAAVYDPWPEYQRKLEAARKAKEVEDAKRKAVEDAEEAKWKAEEDRKRVDEDNQRAEEGARKAEDASKVNEGTKLAKKAVAKTAKEKRHVDGEPKKRRKRKSKPAEGEISTTNVNTTMAANDGADTQAKAELEELMARIRAMHAKHPELLIKRWELERQQHLQQAPPGNHEIPQTQADDKRKRRAPKKTATPAGTSSASTSSVQPAPQPEQHTSPASEPVTSVQMTAPLASTSAQPQQPASAVQPPQNDSAKKPGTQWPKGEKKKKIASAAAKYLLDRRTSQSVPTDASDIAKKLDDNPSYVELCEWIERRGFKLERDTFARALLQSVPDLNSAAGAPNKSQSPAPLMQPVSWPSSQAKQTPHLDEQHAKGITHQKSLSVQPPSVPPRPAGMNGVQQYINGSWQSQPERQSHYKPPGMYRPEHRSPYFGDSQIDYQRSLPPLPGGSPTTPATSQFDGGAEEKKLETYASKQEAARKRNFADIVDLTALSDDDLPPMPKRLEMHQPTPGFIPPEHVVPSRPMFPSPYNAGGREWMPPATQPAQGFFSVPQPPPPRVDSAIREHLRNKELAKPIDKKKALKRNSYDPRTIARDVLLATGRHPEMAALNAHLEILKITFPKQIVDNTDLSTIRWDLIDPGDPIPRRIIQDRDSGFDDNDADNETEEERPSIIRRAVHTGVDANGTSTIVAQRVPPSVAARKGALKIKRSRGRPPGFRISGGESIRSRPFGFDGETGDDRPTNSSKKDSSSNKDPSSTSQNAPSSKPGVAWKPGMSYSEYRAAMEAAGTPLANKKGRPVGWRKNPEGSSSSAVKPKPQPKQKPAEQKPPQAKFPEFKCEWENCGSRLHNLETLQRHVLKLHPHPKDRRDKNIWNCLWAACGATVQRIDEERGERVVTRERLGFNAIDKLHDHIQNKHISPIAWQLGDGPKGGLSGESYLNPIDLK